MALLDLQGMETPASELTAAKGGSSASGHSCPSNLSAALCDHNSGLSVALCYEPESF
jgi:hypothetical protein